MKRRNIKAILRKKFDSFLSSIDDQNVMKAVADNTIITGGAITSMLAGEPINDFDLYFKNHETTRMVADYFVKKFAENPPPKFRNTGQEVPIFIEDDGDRVKIVIKSAGVASENGDKDYQYFEADSDPDDVAAAEYVAAAIKAHQEDDNENRPSYRPIFLSANAITLADRIQIVIRFYGEPDEIHDNYDFVHCTNYWTSWDNNLVLKPDALEALINKELRYIGSKYPVATIFRVRKFLERGWHISAGQLFKIAYQISDLDLNDYAVLEDQLTGVDMAYFAQVLALLRERTSNGKQVDGAYLMQLMDKMF